MERLHVDFGVRGQLRKSNRRIDVITQQLFAKCHLAGEKAFDSFTKKSLPKGGINLCPLLERFL